MVVGVPPGRPLATPSRFALEVEEDVPNECKAPLLHIPDKSANIKLGVSVEDELHRVSTRSVSLRMRFYAVLLKHESPFPTSSP